MDTIKRKAKLWGGSLSLVIGKYVCQEENIEDGDDVVFEIKEVIKPKGKKKK
jgi:antitoxin component of MazEF toxin-antitoxin module